MTTNAAETFSGKTFDEHQFRLALGETKTRARFSRNASGNVSFFVRPENLLDFGNA